MKSSRCNYLFVISSRRHYSTGTSSYKRNCWIPGVRFLSHFPPSPPPLPLLPLFSFVSWIFLIISISIFVLYVRFMRACPLLRLNWNYLPWFDWVEARGLVPPGSRVRFPAPPISFYHAHFKFRIDYCSFMSKRDIFVINPFFFSLSLSLSLFPNS